MNDLGWWLLQNAATTALLVPPVWLLARLRRSHPAEQHLLWLLLLIKLVTPPVIHWPWPAADLRDWATAAETERVAPQPEAITPPSASSDPTPFTPLDNRFSSIEVPEATPIDSEPEPPIASLAPTSQALVSRPAPPGALFPPSPALPTLEALPTLPAPEEPSPRDFPADETSTASIEPRESDLLRQLAFALWLFGAAVVAVRLAVHIRRQRNLLRTAAEAPAALREIANEVAAALNLRPVLVRVTSQADSPFVSCLARPVLVWPVSLTDDASLASCRGVLAHELAHLRRRDHWVVRLEALASLAWWWNPVFWLLRRRLDESRELACDALAVGSAASDRRALAELLLAFSTAGRPAPRLAPLQTGVAPRHSLRRRLAMLFDHSVSGRVSAAGLTLAALLACATLPGWTRAQENAPVTPATSQDAPAAPITDPAQPVSEKFDPAEDLDSADTSLAPLAPSAQNESGQPIETPLAADPATNQLEPGKPIAPDPQPGTAQPTPEAPQVTPIASEPVQLPSNPRDIDLGGGKTLRIEPGRDGASLVLSILENGRLVRTDIVNGFAAAQPDTRPANFRHRGPVLLFFTAQWNVPGQRMLSDIRKIDEVPVDIIDIDRHPDVAKYYAINAIPTVVAAVGLKELGRFSGVQSETSLRNLVKELKQFLPDGARPSPPNPNWLQAITGLTPTGDNLHGPYGPSGVPTAEQIPPNARVRLLQNALELALLEVEEKRIQLESGKTRQADEQRLYEKGFASRPPEGVRLLELDLKKAQLKADQARVQLEAATELQPPAADAFAAPTPPDAHLAALEAALELASLEVQEKEVLLDQGKKEQARWQSLFDRKVVSEQERPDIRLQEIELKKAKLKLNQAKSALDAARSSAQPTGATRR